jgi:hypothetical protein
MRFQIISGTAIQGSVEHCDSAAEALDRVRALVKVGLPNVRIFDDDGELRSLAQMRRLAGQEAKQDR